MDAMPDIFSVLQVAGNSSNTTNEQMEEGHRTEFFGGAHSEGASINVQAWLCRTGPRTQRAGRGCSNASSLWWC